MKTHRPFSNGRTTVCGYSLGHVRWVNDRDWPKMPLEQRCKWCEQDYQHTTPLRYEAWRITFLLKDIFSKPNYTAPEAQAHKLIYDILRKTGEILQKGEP